MASFDEIRRTFPSSAGLSDEEIAQRVATLTSQPIQSIASQLGMRTGADRSLPMAALSSGTDDLQGVGYSAVGALADIASRAGIPGAASARDWANRGANRNALESAINGRPEYNDVTDQSLGSMPAWALYQGVKQIPNIVGTLGAMAVAPAAAVPAWLARAGAVAPRAIGGAGLEAGASVAARRAALARGTEFGKDVVGGMGVGSAMGLGSMYGESVEAGDPSPFAALAASPLYGLTETLPAAVLKNTFRGAGGAFDGNLLTRMAKAGGVNAVAGATSEGVQNEMEMPFNPNLTDAERFSRRVNAIAAGGVAEGGFGSLAGIRKAIPDREPVDLLQRPQQESLPPPPAQGELFGTNFGVDVDTSRVINPFDVGGGVNALRQGGSVSVDNPQADLFGGRNENPNFTLTPNVGPAPTTAQPAPPAPAPATAPSVNQPAATAPANIQQQAATQQAEEDAKAERAAVIERFGGIQKRTNDDGTDGYAFGNKTFNTADALEKFVSKTVEQERGKTEARQRAESAYGDAYGQLNPNKPKLPIDKVSQEVNGLIGTDAYASVDDIVKRLEERITREKTATNPNDTFLKKAAALRDALTESQTPNVPAPGDTPVSGAPQAGVTPTPDPMAESNPFVANMADQRRTLFEDAFGPKLGLLYELRLREPTLPLREVVKELNRNGEAMTESEARAALEDVRTPQGLKAFEDRVKATAAEVGIAETDLDAILAAQVDKTADVRADEAIRTKIFNAAFGENRAPIMQLYADGLTQSQIAERLRISQSTVSRTLTTARDDEALDRLAQKAVRGAGVSFAEARRALSPARMRSEAPVEQENDLSPGPVVEDNRGAPPDEQDTRLDVADFATSESGSDTRTMREVKSANSSTTDIGAGKDKALSNRKSELEQLIDESDDPQVVERAQDELIEVEKELVAFYNSPEYKAEAQAQMRNAEARRAAEANRRGDGEDRENPELVSLRKTAAALRDEMEDADRLGDRDAYVKFERQLQKTQKQIADFANKAAKAQKPKPPKAAKPAPAPAPAPDTPPSRFGAAFAQAMQTGEGKTEDTPPPQPDAPAAPARDLVVVNDKQLDRNSDKFQKEVLREVDGETTRDRAKRLWTEQKREGYPEWDQLPPKAQNVAVQMVSGGNGRINLQAGDQQDIDRLAVQVATGALGPVRGATTAVAAQGQTPPQDDGMTIEGTGTLVTEKNQREVLEAPVNKLNQSQRNQLAEHYDEEVDSDAFFSKLREDVVRYATKGAEAVAANIRHIIKAVAPAQNAKGVQYSKRRSVAEGGSRVEVVRRQILQFIRTKNSDKLVIVQSFSDLDPALLRRVDANERTMAFVADGRAYLIADNIEPGKARSVFMHEVGAHLGMEKWLNKSYDQLVDKINEWAGRNDGSIEHRLAVRALKRNFSAETAIEQYNSELVAYFIEEAIDAGIDPTALKTNSPLAQWFKSLMSAMRAAYARLMGDAADLTAQDLVDLAYGAAKLEMDSAVTTDDGTVQPTFAGTESLRNRSMRNEVNKLGEQLRVAKVMERMGTDGNDIWSVTGWMRGPDGKWRYEIDDSQATVVPFDKIADDAQLSEVLDHPNLYKAYPDLAKVRVKKIAKGAARQGLNGYFNAAENAIYVTDTGRKFKSLLLHELQHWVQSKEDFGRGGSPDSMSVLNREGLVALGNHYDDLRNSYSERSDAARYFKPLMRAVEVLRSGADRQTLLDLQSEIAEANDTADRLLDAYWKTVQRPVVTRKVLRLSDEVVQAQERAKEAQRKFDAAVAKMVGSREMVEQLKYDMYRLLAGEAEARNTQLRMDYSPELRRTNAPQATVDVLADDQLVIRYSKRASASSPRMVDSLPPSARYGAATAGDLAKRFGLAAMITEDIADLARKYLPSVDRYVRASKQIVVERARGMQEIDRIAEMYDRLATHERGNGDQSVNKMLRDMTLSGKWAFEPDWVDGTEIDPALQARFKVMTPTAQNVVKAVFKRGHEMQASKRAALLREIDKQADDDLAATKDGNKKKAIERRRQTAKDLTAERMKWNTKIPYTPLKRYGEYVMVAKSDAYIAAELKHKELGDRRDLSKLESDSRHYVVSFHETMGEAQRARDELESQTGGKFAFKQAFQKDVGRETLYGSTDLFLSFGRLKNLLSAQFSDPRTKDSRALRRAADMINDLYILTLAETSARKSELERRKVSGADQDMMRAFVTQGRADAHFLAQMNHGTEVLDALVDMRGEATKSGDIEEARRYANEFTLRHAQGMDYKVNRVVDGLKRTTSIWMLATSPAYYFQQLVQPFVLSLPMMGGQFGLGRSAKALTDAYKLVGPLLPNTGVSGRLDVAKLAPDDRAVIEAMIDMGRVDMNMDDDLGRFDSDNTALNRGDAFLRGANNKVEQINRIATALAAHKLYLSKNPGDKQGAINYAARIIHQTHGSYDGFNSPRVMGGVSSWQGLFLQFKKFQIIQLSLLARLFNDSFRNVDPAEKAVARKQLTFVLGNAFLLGGALGLPAANVMLALVSAIFGDEDEPDEPELLLRRAIGDKDIADLLLKGVPAALGVDISGKVGMGNVLSLLPYTNVDLTSRSGMEKVMVALSGPFFGGLLPKATDGVGLMAKGEYVQGAEKLLPNGMGNALKGIREGTTGVVARNGDMLVRPEDINLVEMGFQMAGLPPSQVTDRFRVRDQLQSYEKFYAQRGDEIKQSYVKAYRDNDAAGMAEAREEWQRIQESRRRNGFTPQPMSSLIRAPMKAAERERNVIDGVGANKYNRRFVEEVAQ